MARKIYGAYGSNINLRQMAYRCPNAKVIGQGILNDYELTFRRGGYANIEPKKEQVYRFCFGKSHKTASIA